MCLFNPGQANSQCGHQECKNFYLFSKPICLKTTPPSEQRANLAQISNNDFNLNDTQTLLQPTSQNINALLASKLIVPTTIKRSLPVKNEQNNDEETELAINKKKIKIDGGELVVDPNQMTQNPYFPMPANKDLISNPYATSNPIPQNNPVLLNQPRENTSNSNQVLLSLLQNLQQSQANTNTQNQQQNMLKNMQYAIPNVGAVQGYGAAAPSALKTQQDLFSQIQVSAGGLDPKLPQELEEMINEFQTKTLGFLFTQNKMLVDLNERNELVQETLALLIGEITSLKNVVATKTQDKNVTKNPNTKATSNTHQPIMTASESITADDLLAYLYGEKNNWDYQLVLQNELGLPLYRERNFEFNINLIDNHGKLVENANKIPLTLSIYTCENPPKYIDSNTAGNKIFKGFTEKDLIRGNAGFEKIQIKEVTSHFRNGWIFLVIHPKVSNLPQSNIFLGKDGVMVDAAQIKPLILEKVIVKAKKTKEKDE